VIHINQQLVLLAKELLKNGIKVIAISSNDTEKYPQDGPIAMGVHAKKNEVLFSISI
jgi:hypothetical protein